MNCLEKVKASINYKLLQQSFLYTFIWGFIAHGYCFANMIVSHDSLNNFYIIGEWTKASFGRFFYQVYVMLTRGKIVLPWLIGILALCWISLAVYLILCMFHIKKTSVIAVVSAICVVNPTVYALAATYIHDLDADLFAMLLAVVSAFLWKKAMEEAKMRERYLLLVLGALLLSVSLGIYQSFISVAIALIMVVSIKNILEGKQFKDVLVQGAHGIGMLAVSAIFYLGEIRFFSSITGYSIMENDSYNGLGNLASLSLDNFLYRVGKSYVDFLKAFKNMVSMYGENVLFVFHIILAITIILTTLYLMKKCKWQERILVIVLGALLPFGMNVSYILSGGMIHDLMRYSFWFIYLLAFVLVLIFNKEGTVPQIVKSVSHLIVMICVLAVVVVNVQTANTVYVKKDLEYQSTLSYMTRLADKMEQVEGYTPGKIPVLFVGENAIGKTREGFESYTEITGVNLTSPVTFGETYDKFFEYMLATPIEIAPNGTLQGDERVEKMPVFPEEGSITMLDGILVVKLDDKK